MYCTLAIQLFLASSGLCASVYPCPGPSTYTILTRLHDLVIIVRARSFPYSTPLKVTARVVIYRLAGDTIPPWLFLYWTCLALLADLPIQQTRCFYSKCKSSVAQKMPVLPFFFSTDRSSNEWLLDEKWIKNEDIIDIIESALAQLK
jgi:hypothetical protein